MAREKYYDPDWRDRFFQKWHGIDVEGILPMSAIANSEIVSAARGTFYQPIPLRYLKIILKRAKASGIQFSTFVDVGCGKGKACFYMACEGYFDRVIGIDISPALITTARDNLKLMKGISTVQFIEADAQSFLLPNKPTLVFLFNPFDAVAMDRFIASNLVHFRTYGSLIAYAFDKDREILKRHGFTTLWRDDTRRLSLHAMLKLN